MTYRQRCKLSVKEAETVLIPNVFQHSLYNTFEEYTLDLNKIRLLKYNHQPFKEIHFLHREKYGYGWFDDNSIDKMKWIAKILYQTYPHQNIKYITCSIDREDQILGSKISFKSFSSFFHR